MAGQHCIEHAQLPQPVLELRILRRQTRILNRLVKAAKHLFERVVVALAVPAWQVSVRSGAVVKKCRVFDDKLIRRIPMPDPQLVGPLLIPRDPGFGPVDLEAQPRREDPVDPDTGRQLKLLQLREQVAMAVSSNLSKLKLDQFARRFRGESIQLSSSFSYFCAAMPLAEDDLKEYLQEPIAALPPSISSRETHGSTVHTPSIFPAVKSAS